MSPPSGDGRNGGDRDGRDGDRWRGGFPFLRFGRGWQRLWPWMFGYPRTYTRVYDARYNWTVRVRPLGSVGAWSRLRWAGIGNPDIVPEAGWMSPDGTMPGWMSPDGTMPGLARQMIPAAQPWGFGGAGELPGAGIYGGGGYWSGGIGNPDIVPATLGQICFLIRTLSPSLEVSASARDAYGNALGSYYGTTAQVVAQMGC